LQEQGEKVKEAEIHYIKEAQVRNIVFNPFLEKKVLRVKKDTEESLKGSIPPKLQEANKCKYCSFEKFCYDDKKVEARVQMLTK
jgi:CRISPR/Cas system-associated exonuclease Cas4 (RecB family)